MRIPTFTDGIQIWDELVESYLKMLSAQYDFHHARKKFLEAEEVDRVLLMGQALIYAGHDQATALAVSKLIDISELMQLFNELVAIASFTHRYAHIVRELILKLPREWVLERIEEVAEPHLLEGDDNEYRRLLELYIELDDDLTRRLALRAAAHSDPHIKEAGEEYLEYLAESE